jgi:hypothetical protein
METSRKAAVIRNILDMYNMGIKDEVLILILKLNDCPDLEEFANSEEKIHRIYKEVFDGIMVV